MTPLVTDALYRKGVLVFASKDGIREEHLGVRTYIFKILGSWTLKPTPNGSGQARVFFGFFRANL